MSMEAQVTWGEQHWILGFFRAVAILLAIPTAFVLARLGLEWAAQQAWLAYAVQYAIAIPVAVFVIFAVVTGFLKGLR